MVYKDNFSILRTNVKLTSNYKILVGGEDKYISAISSDIALTDIRYKNLLYKKNQSFITNIKTFWTNTNSDIIYKVKNDEVDTVVYEYENQYDNLYWCGCNTINDKSVKYDYEYFAPFFLNKSVKDDYFVIFRVDGVGLLNLTSNNFTTEILDKLKIVDVKSLQTYIGDITDELLSYDDNFIDININVGEFSYWYGIDVVDGVFTKKGIYLKDIFQEVQKISDIDMLMTNGFSENDLITSKILNISFLFNDPYATDMTINRYYGFYGNLKIIKRINLKKPTKLKTDISFLNIDSNNTFININTKEYINPFYNDVVNDLCVEYNGNIYNVVVSDGKYRIVCDVSLENKITNINFNILNISNNILSYSTEYNTTGDIFNSNNDISIININNINYRLKKIDGVSYIHTDVIIDYNNDVLNNISTTNVDIFDFIFNDICDFDTNIVNTKYSDFEYDNNKILNTTAEPKIYREVNNEKDLYILDNNYVNIPTTSEYISTGELFEVYKNDDVYKLNNLWKKNPIFCKFGYINSIDSSDYIHRINPIFDHSKVDIDSIIPNRSLKNLDYFYNINFNTIGDIDNQTLSITNYNTIYNINYFFDVNSYFTSDVYFTNFFKYKEYIKGYKTVDKTALVNGINDVNYTNNFLFKGILCKKNKKNGDKVIPTNNFKDYDVSMLLSPLSHYVINSNIKEDIIYDMLWVYCKRWVVNISYNIGDIVYYTFKYQISDNTTMDVIDYFIVSEQHISTTAPIYNFGKYTILSTNIMYSSVNIYNVNDIVYYNGNWWIANNIIPKSIYSADGSLSVNNFPDFNSNWIKIEMYNKNITQNYYIIDNGVYDNTGKLIKTLKSDGSVLYTVGDLVLHNNSLIYLKDGSGYLKDGINIYIDDKNKNIMFHLYNNDTTLTTTNINRDEMYDIKYSKFTAKSFIKYIENNDVGTFLNKLNIIVKDVSGNIKQYDYSTFKYKFTFKNFDYIDKKYKHVLYDKILNKNYNVNANQIIKYDLISNEILNYYDNKEIAYILNGVDNKYSNFSITLFNGCYYPIFNKIDFKFNIFLFSHK